MYTHTRYANLTDEQREAIVRTFREWSSLPGIEVGQAVSCAAKDGLGLTINQWNSKQGEDAFASALGVLVMRNEVNLVVS